MPEIPGMLSAKDLKSKGSCQLREGSLDIIIIEASDMLLTVAKAFSTRNKSINNHIGLRANARD